MTLVLFLVGLVLLMAGGEVLVRGASRLAGAVGISPLVIGLTVVAFSTSAPELAVTVQSAVSGNPDIAIGNIVGSNIANILLILGLSAMVLPLVVAQKLIHFDIPLMIGVSALLLLLGLDGTISRLEGIVLIALLITYVVVVVRQSRRESRAVKEEYAAAFPSEAEPDSGPVPPWWQNLLLVIVGVAMLVVGAGWLVDGAVVAAQALGVDELVIGLTIVAVGTSLPEIATSIIASVRGERDIAAGNVIGSNIFNILSVAGFTAIVAADGVPVAPAALSFDIPVMIAASVACLPIAFIGKRINRWQGGLFVGYYIAYTLYLMLSATHHAALPWFSNIMLWFVMPLSGVTLAIYLWRSARRPRSATSV